MTTRILNAFLPLLFLALTGPVAFGQEEPRRPGRPAAVAPAPQPQVRILTVRDADAAEIVQTIRELFAGEALKKTRLALHQSTNSIVLFGEPDDMERIESIILRLDVVAAEKKKAKPENKRPDEKSPRQPEEAKEQLELAESNLEQTRERVAWSERMVKLGYMSAAQAVAERSRLASAEVLLAQARREVKAPQAAEEKAKGAATLWEYKVVSMEPSEARWEAELKKVGEDGWELAGVVEKPTGGRLSSTILLFKRAKK